MGTFEMEKKGRICAAFLSFNKLKIFQGQNLFLANHKLPPKFFQLFQKFCKMPFFVKHKDLKLKMSVIWKCFDGIQQEEISESDVRNMFRFQ